MVAGAASANFVIRHISQAQVSDATAAAPTRPTRADELVAIRNRVGRATHVKSAQRWAEAEYSNMKSSTAEWSQQWPSLSQSFESAWQHRSLFQLSCPPSNRRMCAPRRANCAPRSLSRRTDHSRLKMNTCSHTAKQYCQRHPPSHTPTLSERHCSRLPSGSVVPCGQDRPWSTPSGVVIQSP